MLGWLELGQKREGPRFSDALGETATYRIDYGDWRPLTLAGDPAIIADMPRRQAVPLSRILLAMADQRADAARSVLTRYGLDPRPDPFDWEEVETLLAKLVEANLEPRNEPASVPWHQSRYAPFRPKFWAFLHDLAFLYAQAICAARPGARLVEADKGRSRDAGYFSPMPVVLDPRDPVPLMPFDAVMEAAALSMAEGHGDVLPRLLRSGNEGAPARLTPADVTAWHDGFVRDHGREATADEIAAYLVDNRATEDALPPQIARRLGPD